MQLLRLLRPVATLVAVSSGVCANVPLEQAARLYAQPDAIRMPQVSPNGSEIAYVSTIDGRDGLIVVHRDTGRSDLAAHAKTNIMAFAWKSDDQIVFLGNGVGRAEGFLYLVDLAAKKQRHLVEFGGQIPDVRWYDALPASPARMLAIRSRIGTVDLGNGAFTLTEPYASYPRPGSYVPGLDGTLRVRVVYKPDEMLLQERASDRDGFATIRRLKWTGPDQAMGLAGFGSDPNVLYTVQFDSADAGRLVEMDARTGAEGRELYRAASGQLTGAIFSPDHARLEGVLYFDTVRRAHWFNDRLRALQGAIDATLPGRINDTLSFSTDQTVVLARSATSSDPGEFYLFDARHGAKILIGPRQPGIDPAKQGTMTATTIPARDGFLLHAYLLQPRQAATGPRPVLIVPQRLFSDRWVESYGAQQQMLLSQGYTLLEVDFRGTAGYGYAYWHAGELQLADAIPNDINDAAQWAIRSGIADPKRIGLMAADDGATIALTAATRAPGLYRCVVNDSGVADLIYFYDNRDRLDWFARKSLRFAIQLEPAYLTRASALPQVDRLPDAVFNIYRDAFHNRDWEALRDGLDHAHKRYTLMTELPRASFHPPEEVRYNENVQLLRFLEKNL